MPQRTKTIYAGIAVVMGAALISLAVSFPAFLPVARRLLIGWWDDLFPLIKTRHPNSIFLLASGSSLCAAFVLLHLGMRRCLRQSKNRWAWSGTSYLMLIFVAAFACCFVGRRAGENIYWLPPSRSVEPGMKIATDPISMGRQLGIQLRLYSPDNQGNYPPQMEILVRETMLSPDDFYALFWREWNPGHVESWLYNGTITDSSPSEWPLFISPEFERGNRIVVFNDISAKKLSRDQFRTWISKWKTTSKEYNIEWSKELRDLLNLP
jgi:hypothetical protein